MKCHLKIMQQQNQGSPRPNKLTNGLTALLLMLCASHVNAGALYVYETANPTDTAFTGAGLAGRAQDA